jgi:hypothetical protein
MRQAQRMQGQEGLSKWYTDSAMLGGSTGARVTRVVQLPV